MFVIIKIVLAFVPHCKCAICWYSLGYITGFFSFCNESLKVWWLKWGTGILYFMWSRLISFPWEILLSSSGKIRKFRGSLRPQSDDMWRMTSDEYEFKKGLSYWIDTFQLCSSYQSVNKMTQNFGCP